MLFDYFIDYYGKSNNYNTADIRFKMEISPFIHQMTSEQIVQLIKVTENNRQIYNRGAAYGANSKIVLWAKKVLPPDFDYGAYPHFRFNSEILSEDDKKEPVDICEKNDLPI